MGREIKLFVITNRAAVLGAIIRLCNSIDLAAWSTIPTLHSLIFKYQN